MIFRLKYLNIHTSMVCWKYRDFRYINSFTCTQR